MKYRIGARLSCLAAALAAPGGDRVVVGWDWADDADGTQATSLSLDDGDVQPFWSRPSHFGDMGGELHALIGALIKSRL